MLGIHIVVLSMMLVILPSCRQRDDDGSDVRIFGGQRVDDATPAGAMFKAVVGLQMIYGQCTGVFVTSEIALTAAHCPANRTDGGLQFRYKGKDYTSVNVIHQGFVGRAEAASLPKSATPFKDLVAVLFPTGSAPEGVSMGICSTGPKVGDDVYMVGYGVTDLTQPMTAGIKRYTESSVMSVNHETGLIVAGRSGSGALSGDSGGPLISKRGKCVLGIATYISKTATGFLTTTYVNVTEDQGRTFVGRLNSNE